jgi:polar amino acid transport system substrate-binding protein
MSLSKKTIAVVAALVLAMSLALIGCGDKTPEPAPAPAPSTETPAADTGAAGDLKLIKEGTLTVGSDCDYPPFIYLEGDKPAGFEYELMGAIAKDLGLTLEYLPPQNFDTLITSVQGGGKMDLSVSSQTITDERLQSIDFCTPYFDSNQAVVVLKSSSVKSSADLAGLTVGAQSGTTGEMWANENIPGVTVKGYNQTSEGLAALQAGDIKALIFDEPVAAEQVSATYTDCAIIEVIPTGESYGFGVSKDNPALKDKVNASLKKLMGDGTYNTIFKKYFPDLEPTVK